MPFEAIGDKAQWVLIYEYLLTMGIDDVVTYDQLSHILGRPFGENRGPFAQALTVLERDNLRTMVNVRGVGYRMAAASEHFGLVKKDHRSVKRRMKRTLRRARSTDRAQLEPQERDRMDRIELTLQRQSDMLRRFERRETRIKDALEEGRRTSVREEGLGVEELREQISELNERLARHGFAPQA